MSGHTLMSRIFNPSAPSNQPLPSAYRRHDKEKRRKYQQRVHEVENASFTPLIFTTTGGMGDAATQFYKRLANLLRAKHSLSYGIVMGWLRCKLSFSLLRSAIICAFAVPGPVCAVPLLRHRLLCRSLMPIFKITCFCLLHTVLSYVN